MRVILTMKISNKELKIRGLSSEEIAQLDIIVKKENYSSRNEFLLNEIRKVIQGNYKSNEEEILTTYLKEIIVTNKELTKNLKHVLESKEKLLDEIDKLSEKYARFLEYTDEEGGN